MGFFDKDEVETEVKTAETTEATETTEVETTETEKTEEKPKRKRKPRAKKSTSKTTKRAPKRTESVTKSAPSTKAATTLTEFTRIMAVYRNQTVPARYSKNRPDKYIEPLQGNYQNDIYDPYEVKGVDYWVTVLDYATRYPVSTNYSFTGTNCTVNKIGAADSDDFEIIVDQGVNECTIVLDQPTLDAGWHVCTADIQGKAKFFASLDATDIDVELTPRIKGKLRYCSFTESAGQVLSFTIQAQPGAVIKLSNFQFYRLAHNIA